MSFNGVYAWQTSPRIQCYGRTSHKTDDWIVRLLIPYNQVFCWGTVRMIISLGKVTWMGNQRMSLFLHWKLFIKLNEAIHHLSNSKPPISFISSACLLCLSDFSVRFRPFAVLTHEEPWPNHVRQSSCSLLLLLGKTSLQVGCWQKQGTTLLEMLGHIWSGWIWLNGSDLKKPNSLPWFLLKTFPSSSGFVCWMMTRRQVKDFPCRNDLEISFFQRVTQLTVV